MSGGMRWLINRVAALGPEMALLLATPGERLTRDDLCHVHSVYAAIFDVQGHDGAVYAAMQDIFDWHNARTTTLPDEGYFRCLAIYGAAAMAVVEERPPASSTSTGRPDDGD